MREKLSVLSTVEMYINNKFKKNGKVISNNWRIKNFEKMGENVMKVKQISIFLENKSGRLAEVTKVLGDNEINIRALSIADTTDFGILRLIVNNPEKAWKILKEQNFTVSETEIIAVQVPDQPGGLAGILNLLENNSINIEYMYAFVGKSGMDAVVVFRVENIDRAIDLLQKQRITLLSGKEIYT